MTFKLTKDELNAALKTLSESAALYGPKLMPGQGAFSDTDVVRYGMIESIDDVVFDRKSDYSFKEILLPITETMFYFTEKSMTEPKMDDREIIIFLRSCDLEAVKRLDDIYLNNGPADFFYKRLREKVRFWLMPCAESFASCFCLSMGTGASSDYDASLEPQADGSFAVNNHRPEWAQLFPAPEKTLPDIPPSSPASNPVKVDPARLDKLNMSFVAQLTMWDEYDQRCINCGRCNFVCPTCTCFTAQDIFHLDNPKVGERRRVWSSCMVDGFTDMAGGHSFRQKNGQRIRFKALHKMYDFNKRFGRHMCVGCGRCDDICPEYISFSHTINKLAAALEEGEKNDPK